MRDSTKLAILTADFDAELSSSSKAIGSQPPISRHIDSKRAFDVVIALTALVLLSIVIVITAIIIKFSSRGPVVFRHPRIGRDGKVFECFKFRTMHVDGDEILKRHLADNPLARSEWDATQKLRDDPRVTSIGRVLRISSVDELPQLVNILRGDMSVVGPRPIVQAEVGRYGPYFDKYCSVRPGLTGLWQVSGRSDVDYDKRVALDCDYVARRSLIVDIAIIVRTLPAVFVARGAC